MGKWPTADEYEQSFITGEDQVSSRLFMKNTVLLIPDSVPQGTIWTSDFHNSETK